MGREGRPSLGHREPSFRAGCFEPQRPFPPTEPASSLHPAGSQVPAVARPPRSPPALPPVLLPSQPCSDVLPARGRPDISSEQRERRWRTRSSRHRSLAGGRRVLQSQGGVTGAESSLRARRGVSGGPPTRQRVRAGGVWGEAPSCVHLLPPTCPLLDTEACTYSAAEAGGVARRGCPMGAGASGAMLPQALPASVPSWPL